MPEKVKATAATKTVQETDVVEIVHSHKANAVPSPPTVIMRANENSLRKDLDSRVKAEKVVTTESSYSRKTSSQSDC